MLLIYVDRYVDEVLAQPANILCKISTTLIRLTATFHMTLILTFAQVVETSVTITDNSPFKDYNHPDDQTTLLKLGLFF